MCRVVGHSDVYFVADQDMMTTDQTQVCDFIPLRCEAIIPVSNSFIFVFYSEFEAVHEQCV